MASILYLNNTEKNFVDENDIYRKLKEYSMDKYFKIDDIRMILDISTENCRELFKLSCVNCDEITGYCLIR